MLRLLALTLALAPGCRPAVGGVDVADEPRGAAAVDVRAPALTRGEVVVDGHPIAVWSKAAVGEERGVFVLVHGRTWSARPDFDLQVPGERRSLMDALAARGYTSFAVDLRGYGETPRDASGWLTPDRAGKDLLGVLEGVAEDRGPAVVLGWSLGSLVAQLAAQRQPGLVSALVLYGYPRDPARPDAGGPDPEGPPAREPNTRAAAASDFITPGAISRAATEAFVEAALAADPVRVDWRGIAGWGELDPGKIAVPTLVIHGAGDPYAKVAHQARLFSAIASPDRAWVVIPGADHAAHLEDAGPAFVHALLAFVERPRRSPMLSH